MHVAPSPPAPLPPLVHPHSTPAPSNLTNHTTNPQPHPHLWWLPAMPAASAVSPRATRSSKRALVPENPPTSTAADKDAGGATTQTRGRSGIQPTSSGNQRRPLATKTNTTTRNAAQANEEARELRAPAGPKQQGSATAAGGHQPAQRLPVACGAGAAAAAALLATTPRRSSRSMSEPESVDSELERALLLESQQPPTRMSSLAKPAAAPQAQAVKSIQAARQPQAETSVAGPSRLPLSPLTPSQRKNAPARPPSRQRSIDSLAEFDAEWVEESKDISKRSAILAAVTAPQQQQQQKRPATPTSAARRGAGAPGSQQRVPRASTPVPGRSYLDDQMIYGAGDNDDDLPSLLGAAAAARRTPSISSSAAAARGRRQQQRASDHASARKRRPGSPSPSMASKNRKRLMLPALGSDALDQEMAKTKEARTAAFVRSASEALARSSQSLHGSARKVMPVQGSARKAVERSGGGSKTEGKRRRKEMRREEDEEGEVDEADPFGFFKAEERIKRRRVIGVGSATKGRQEQEDANEEGGGNGGENGADLAMREDGGVQDAHRQGHGQVPKTPQRPQGQDDDVSELPDVRGLLAQSNAAQLAAEGESEDDDAILRRILGSADASSDPPRAPEKNGDNMSDKAVPKGQAGGQANASSSDTDDYITPGLGRGKKRAASKTPSKSKKSASISPVMTRKKGNPKTPASAKRQQPRRGPRRTPAARGKGGEGSDAVDSSDSDINHGNSSKWKVDSLMEQVLPRRYAAPKNRKKQQEQKKQKQQKRARFEDDEDDENDQGEDSLLGPVWSSDDSSSSSVKGKGDAKGKKGKGKAPASAARGGRAGSKKATPAAKRKATSTSSSSTKGAKTRSPRNVTTAATRVTRGGTKKTTAATGSGTGTGLGPSSSPTPHMTYDPDDDDDEEEDEAGSTTRRSTSGKSVSSNYGRGPPTAEQLEDRRRRGDDALEEYEFEEELVLDR